MTNNNNNKTVYSFTAKLKDCVSAWARNYKQQISRAVARLSNWGHKMSGYLYQAAGLTGKSISTNTLWIFDKIVQYTRSVRTRMIVQSNILFGKVSENVGNAIRHYKQRILPYLGVRSAVNGIIKVIPKAIYYIVKSTLSYLREIARVVFLGHRKMVIEITSNDLTDEIDNWFVGSIVSGALLSLAWALYDSEMYEQPWLVVRNIKRVMSKSFSYIYVRFDHLLLQSYNSLNQLSSDLDISSVVRKCDAIVDSIIHVIMYIASRIWFIAAGNNWTKHRDVKKIQDNKKNNDNDDNSGGRFGYIKKFYNRYSSYGIDAGNSEKPTLATSSKNAPGGNVGKKDIKGKSKPRMKTESMTSSINIDKAVTRHGLKIEEVKHEATIDDGFKIDNMQLVEDKNLIDPVKAPKTREIMDRKDQMSRRGFSVVHPLALSNVLVDLADTEILNKMNDNYWFELIDDKVIKNMWVPWLSQGRLNKRGDITLQDHGKIDIEVSQPIRKRVRELFEVLRQDYHSWDMSVWLIHDLIIGSIMYYGVKTIHDFAQYESEILSAQSLSKILDMLRYEDFQLPRSLREAVAPAIAEFRSNTDSDVMDDDDIEIDEGANMDVESHNVESHNISFIDTLEDILVQVGINRLVRRILSYLAGSKLRVIRVIAKSAGSLYVCIDIARIARGLWSLRSLVKAYIARSNNKHVMINNDFSNDDLIREIQDVNMDRVVVSNTVAVNRFMKTSNTSFILNYGTPIIIRNQMVDDCEYAPGLDYKAIQLTPGYKIGHLQCEGRGVATIMGNNIITATHVIYPQMAEGVSDMIVYNTVKRICDTDQFANVFRRNAKATGTHSKIYILRPETSFMPQRFVHIGNLAQRICHKGDYIMRIEYVGTNAAGLSGSLMFNSLFKPIGVLQQCWSDISLIGEIKKVLFLPYDQVAIGSSGKCVISYAKEGHRNTTQTNNDVTGKPVERTSVEKKPKENKHKEVKPKLENKQSKTKKLPETKEKFVPNLTMSKDIGDDFREDDIDIAYYLSLIDTTISSEQKEEVGTVGEHKPIQDSDIGQSVNRGFGVHTKKISAMRLSKLFDIDHGKRFRGLLPILVDFFGGSRKTYLLRSGTDDDFYHKMFPLVLTRMLGETVVVEDLDMSKFFEIQHVVDQLDTKKMRFTVDGEHDWLLRYPIFYNLCSIFLHLNCVKANLIVYNVVNMKPTFLRLLLDMVEKIIGFDKTVVFVINDANVPSYSEADLGVFFGSGSTKIRPEYKDLHDSHEKKLKLISSTVMSLCTKMLTLSSNADLGDMTFNVSYVREFLRSGKACFEFPLELAPADIISISSIDILVDIVRLTQADSPVELTVNKEKVIVINPIVKIKHFINKLICKCAIGILNAIQVIKDKTYIFADKVMSELVDTYRPGNLLQTVKTNIPSFSSLRFNKRIGLGITVFGTGGLAGAVIGATIDLITFAFLEQQNDVTNLINLVVEPTLLVVLYIYYLIRPNFYRSTSTQYSDIVYYHNAVNTIKMLDNISVDVSAKIIRLSLKIKSNVISWISSINVSNFKTLLDSNIKNMRRKVRNNNILFKGDLLLACLAVCDVILSLGLSISTHQLRAAMGLWSFVEQTSRIQGKLAEQVKGFLSRFSFISGIDQTMKDVIMISIPVSLPFFVIYLSYQLVKFHHKWMEVLYKQYAAEGNKDSFKRSMDLVEKTAKYNKSIVSYLIVSVVAILKMPTTALRILTFCISAIFGINNSDSANYSMMESVLLFIVGTINFDINSLILAITWLTIGGLGNVTQLLELPVIVYISDVLIGGASNRERAIKISSQYKGKYLQNDLIMPTSCAVISHAEGSKGYQVIIDAYHKFASMVKDHNIRNKICAVISTKERIINEIVSHYKVTDDMNSEISKIINSSKVTDDEPDIGDARSIFHIARIPINKTSSTIPDGVTRKFSYDKRIASILGINVTDTCFLNNTGPTNAAIGLRRRTQPTVKAFNDWKVISQTKFVVDAVEIVILMLRRNNIISASYSGITKFSVYHNIKPNVTPGYVSQFVSGIKRYKTLIKLLLTKNDLNFTTLRAVRFLHSCFVKDEMLRVKDYAEVSTNLEGYMQRNIYTGRKIGNFPRVIIPAESVGRFVHQYTQSIFNDCLLLQRFNLPIKIGLKTSMEWPATVNNNLDWSVSIDITSFDGNQHRGFDILAGIIREACRVNDSGADLLHAIETSLKIVIMATGDVNILAGSQASGDINTSSSNSVRLFLMIIIGLLKLKHYRSDILFICQGDNALLQSDDLTSLKELCDNIDSCGLPVKIEGICNRRTDIIKIPAYLGAIGIEVTTNFVSLVSGKLFSITQNMPWRDFDRYIPKLLTSNTLLNDKNMHKRTDDKLKCWIATYPTDLLLWYIIDTLSIDLSKITVKEVDPTVEYAGHATIDEVNLSPSLWISKGYSLRSIAIPYSITVSQETKDYILARVGIKIRDKIITTTNIQGISASKTNTAIISDVSKCQNCYNIMHILSNSLLNHNLTIICDNAMINNTFDNIIICGMIDKYNYIEVNSMRLITGIKNFIDCRRVLDIITT